MKIAENFLNKVLEIIDYRGNKEEFISEFLNNCYLQAIRDLGENLPEEEREKIKKEISSFKSKEAFNKFVNAQFRPDQIQKALRIAADEGIQKYIKSIFPTLNEQQKKNLQSFHAYPKI